jgi:hypothetical protein
MCLALRRTSVAAIGIAVVISAATGAPALARSAQLFPVPSHLVPAAVVAAFILPAAMAVVTSGLKRIGRSPVRLFGLGLLAAAGVTALAYTRPGLLAGLGV